jgi:septum site-determining protein MinD
MLGIIDSKSLRAEQGQDPVKEHLVITRYVPKRANKGEMLGHADVQELLNIPILGVIPESEVVLECSNQGTPVILANGSPAARAYDDMVARFLGEDRPLRFLNGEPTSLWKRLFGG